MRERLIELIQQGEEQCHKTIQCNDCPGYGYGMVCKSHLIAEYLIANGVIVPPCKIWDTVYVVENPYSFLPTKTAVEGEVVSIHLLEHGLYIRVLFDTKRIHGCVNYNLNWKLNKTVFLTREEAERALKERE